MIGVDRRRTMEGMCTGSTPTTSRPPAGRRPVSTDGHLTCNTRGQTDWFKPYYPQQHQHQHQHQDDHDNSQDSGTASTTICSSTSSSPSPHTMLTHSSPNNPLPPQSRAPLPPPHPLPPHHLTPPHEFPHHPAELALIENSYAEIPYGSLPQNNFNTDPHHPRNDWSKNNNFVNLNLGLEYPLRRDQNHRPEVDVLPSQRGVSGTTIVHLRDGPDGLQRIPEPRMPGLDPPPSPDFRCNDKHGKSDRKSRTCRRSWMYVIIMAVAGLVYLTLGGVAGYYYGTSECQKHYADAIFLPETTSTPTVTSHPGHEVNTTLETSSTEVTTTMGSTTTATTTTTPATPPPPQYCRQEAGVCSCGPFGGSSGQRFTDRDDYHRHGNITGFTVKHNDYFISGIQFQYGGELGGEHGYTDVGFRVNVQLLKDEVISNVQLDFTTGKGYLSRLVVKTDRRELGPYGGQGGESYSIRGGKLLYIQGQSGPLIDQLGLVFDRCL